ncbi:baseplate assembly protein [Poseidonibacter lekithochrous]|uniref:baseplate assembly protein n=1 Tax=Poseidonibacter lekithochrous TaxID=1904463 RepID=UPI000D3B4789|nr:baseplate J/gp47 family protein [Poseidonibacter lekithochrous]
MIDINSLPKPTVLQELNFEDILNENINNLKALLPNWKPLESDEFKMILEAFAYRELHLRAEHNNLASAFFLSTAEDEDLDNYAAFYNVERLKGSKPYSIYEFTLSAALNQDVTIPMNLVLTDENSLLESKLLSDVVIPAGTTTGTGTVELQKEVSTSDIKTEVITTSLPFVVTAAATSDFTHGSNSESNDEFRQRILLSMADKSTAGSEETYKSYTFGADERIEDVAILNGGAGVVNVYYYSKNADELMKTRIEESLNKKEVRPLTDNVVVQTATPSNYSVIAELKILPNQETAKVYTNAVESLTAGLEKLKKIGVDITLSEINDFLKVPGVKEAVISSPGANVNISDNQIGVCSGTNITYTII